jgi:hypothetical protein
MIVQGSQRGTISASRFLPVVLKLVVELKLVLKLKATVKVLLKCVVCHLDRSEDSRLLAWCKV